MKKILSLALAALTALSAAAQPILVGHRGSNYGVENSEESFKTGVKLGYKYLETDVKFTKDNILVCSHDDDTKRLGGTKTLATSTLAELQSETLTQTRLGTTYTGRLCSMKEYLQICKDAGIGALIELKWTAGINSNDCSKIPLLIAQIDEMEMRPNVIILTSMKPCLEYIRTNYPDIELQFLTGEYWASHFGWCVQWKIDADIQAGYFDRSTVKQFHAQGLKVNMWTTNDAAGYTTYGNMGCDFITTDRLDGHNLPELDPDITSPVNEIDYPESSFNPILSTSYSLSAPTITEWPAAFDGLKVRRALRAAEGWYVLAHNADAEAALYYWADSKAPVAMNTDGLEDLSDIALTADGVLVGSILAPATNWRLYSWISTTAEPEEVFNLDEYYDIADIEIGRSMAISGRYNNLKVYLTAPAASGLCAIEYSKGSVQEALVIPFADDFGKGAAAEGQLKISPMSRNNVFLANDGAGYEYVVNIADKTMTVTDGQAILPEGAVAFDWLRYGSRLYTAAAVNYDNGHLQLAVYDPIYDLEPVTMGRTLGVTTNGYTALDVRALTAGNTPVNVFVEGQGIYTCLFDVEATPVEPENIMMYINPEWSFTRNGENFLEELDGTNARQGTAVNGRFYINNCEESLIHVFDRTGHIGTLKGGAGYGCTRDDAGNIIVRNDLATSSTHSFLIYPAGTMPGDAVSPVELTIDFTLDGQTDFINASGDVLAADGGYIYLFPSGQSAVTFAKVASGNLVRVEVADDLSLKGNATAYVVPSANNPLHWYYHIRTSAIKEYTGGVTTDLMAGRTGTTAPQRNSTGGFAVIEKGANCLLVHNSGSNYCGGFTFRDLTTGEVFGSQAPMGNKAKDNTSSYNWLITEKTDDGNYTLYDYCPANGIAVYTLSSSSGLTDISLAPEGSISFDGITITAPGASRLIVTDVMGRVVASGTDTISADTLPRGILIARTQAGAVKIRH